MKIITSCFYIRVVSFAEIFSKTKTRFASPHATKEGETLLEPSMAEPL